MAFAPPAIIDGPARVGLQYGLFSVVTFRPEGDRRWVNGAGWDALTCAPARGIGDPSCDPEVDTIGLPKNLDHDYGQGAATAFTVYGAWACSAASGTPEYADMMARAHLAAREEARAEQALWLGDLGNVPNLTASVTAGGAGATVTGATLREAVAELEYVFARAHGTLGVIHAPRNLALLMVAEDVAAPVGSQLRTKLGTPIVAGAGYPDEGRIVATGQLLGYRTDVFVPSSRAGDLLDRAQNDLYAVAERTYLLGYDPCGVTAATIP